MLIHVMKVFFLNFSYLPYIFSCLQTKFLHSFLVTDVFMNSFIFFDFFEIPHYCFYGKDDRDLIWSFFGLYIFQSAFLMENLFQRWTQSGQFFPKSWQFFRFSKKGREGLPQIDCFVKETYHWR